MRVEKECRMIFVQGTMDMDPACIAEFEADVAAMVDKVRTEDGCEHYALLVENTATGRVQVTERWRDDAALGVHFTQPWIAEFFGKYSGKMLASTVQIWDISGAPRPLPI
jgi:quinol monooxygenase YgiN